MSTMPAAALETFKYRAEVFAPLTVVVNAKGLATARSWNLFTAVRFANETTATTALLVFPSLLVVIPTLANETLALGFCTVTRRMITCPDPVRLPLLVRPPLRKGIATTALPAVAKDAPVTLAIAKLPNESGRAWPTASGFAISTP